MVKRRNAVRSFLRQDLIRLFLTPKPYIVAAAVIVGLLTCYGGLRGYLQRSGGRISPLEFFVMSDASRPSHWIVFTGALVLLCDAPFRCPGDTVRIVRADRRTWLLSQLLFSAVLLCLYFVVLFIFYCAFSLGHWTASAQWSDTFSRAAAQGGREIGIVFGMAPRPGLLKLPPWQAILLTVALQFLFGLLLATLLSLCQLRGRPKLGLVLCALFPLADYILLDAFSSFSVFGKLAYVLSPFSFASVNRLQPVGEYSVIYAFCYFICILTILFFALFQSIKRYDFSS